MIAVYTCRRLIDLSNDCRYLKRACGSQAADLTDITDGFVTGGGIPAPLSLRLVQAIIASATDGNPTIVNTLLSEHKQNAPGDGKPVADLSSAGMFY